MHNASESMSSGFNNCKSVSLKTWATLLILSIVVGIASYSLLQKFIIAPQSKELYGAIQSIIFTLISLQALRRLGTDIPTSFRYYNARIKNSLISASKYLVLLLAAGIILVSTIIFMDFLLSSLGFLPAETFETHLIPESMAQNNYIALNLLNSTPKLLLFIITTSLLAPLGEELFFRRLFYVSLRHRYGFAVSLITSSLLFGVLHGDQWFITFSKGLIIGYSYEKTRNLLSAIFLHSFTNIIALAISFIFIYVR